MEVLHAIDTDRIRGLCDRGEFFWLDLVDASSNDLEALRDVIRIHPQAFEDSNEFGQRTKLDRYADSALVVAYGAEPQAGGRTHVVEVHMHVSGDGVVTVSREPLAALVSSHRSVAANPVAHRGNVVHGVLDALADSFLTALDGVDRAIDSLQEAVVERPTSAHRQLIFALRRDLAEMHRVIAPQRDLLAPDGSCVDVVAGAEADQVRDAFLDVHDHLDRAVGLVRSYREQLVGLLDLYLTEVSTRLNEVMKRLTMIATVFLPLSFLVGFFGMNFGWFVQAITPLWTFIAFGIGLLVTSTAAVVVYLKLSRPG